ncbi:hypothetical protein M9H77_20588 [Catharanthus roseus]|uniref:Uncharacterized protein n=1 Tax=Catharanthus roseus TaxID=4058 RepID=A0ACC0ALX1_CATRO|nr:hypothetical protein M9H77_20588 [Catharanthus roseus]
MWLCCVSAEKIYNVVAKIKKIRMQGQNTVEEVLCLSAQWGYTVFYRNCPDSNVLSDIVVAHPTSIQMMRTWPYVLIMVKQAIEMTPTGKNYTVATAIMQNEQATIYRWVLQQIKHLYYSSAVSAGNEQDGSAHEPCVIIPDRESDLTPVTEEWGGVSGWTEVYSDRIAYWNMRFAEAYPP